MSIPYPASRWSAGSTVVGRLLHWHDAAAFAAALEAADIVEGFDPSPQATRNLYHRHSCTAWAQVGNEWHPQFAWVYIFARDVTAGTAWRPVPSNDWLYKKAAPIALSLQQHEHGPVLCAAASTALIREASAQEGAVHIGSGSSDTVTMPAAVVPGKLFISSELQAQSSECLEACGIKHVVTLTEQAVCPSTVRCLHLPGPDDDTASLQRYVAHGIPFIAAALSSGNGAVLVHCSAGISRSASLVLLYLMRCQAMPLSKAWTYLRAIKPNVQPSLHFWKQLCQWEADWLHTSTFHWQTYAVLAALEATSAWAVDKHVQADKLETLAALTPAEAALLLPEAQQSAFIRVVDLATAAEWDMQQVMNQLLDG